MGAAEEPVLVDSEWEFQGSPVVRAVDYFLG